MINFDHSRKIRELEHSRKFAKNLEHLKILKFLDQGYYAQEISQKLGVSKGNLSRTITSFKSMGFIEQIQSYPKRYKLTDSATLILTQEDLSQRKIQEYITDKGKTPKGIESVRVHKLRFKNKLIQKPHWLNKITKQGRIYGLTVKKLNMTNWDKFLIYFNYSDFHGLDNIEICNNVIIYNFERNIKEQFVSTPKELDDYLDDLISNCKQARQLLEQKGFIIDERDPEFCQKPHFAVCSNEDPNHIGKLGKDILLTVKTPTETREIDDSPPSKGKGEEETDNIEKAKSYLNMPNKLETIKGDVMKIDNRINEIANQVITKADLNNIEQKISGIVNTMQKMTEGMESMAKAITKLVEGPIQETDTKAAPEGIYQ